MAKPIRAQLGATIAGFTTLGMLALAPDALARVTFSDPDGFGAGDEPQAVAVGDFNDDSDPDLAVANAGADTVSVLLGDAPGGGFGAATDFDVGDEPASGRGGRLQRRLGSGPGRCQRG